MTSRMVSPSHVMLPYMTRSDSQITSLLLSSLWQWCNCPAGTCPLIPDTGLLVVTGTWKCKTSLQGSVNPGVPQKITIPTSIIQHGEEVKIYEVCDQLFTQLHALLTLQAGTFIGTLFSMFAQWKQGRPADTDCSTCTSFQWPSCLWRLFEGGVKCECLSVKVWPCSCFDCLQSHRIFSS